MKSGIIYKGPSRIDGAPIVVLATYSNRNTKTGAVVQTYILREDVNPLEASKTGADVSICGTCPLRGTPTTDPARKIAQGRRCYVNLGQGVLITWRAYHRGVYPDAQSAEARASIGRGRVVRVGTYGDGRAVPDHVWDELLSECSAWTAYTHGEGWRPDLAMQSVEDIDTARKHWSAGRRTFRIVTGVAEIDTSNEVLCPASKEAGRRTTCASCKLCSGTATKSPKSIAIPAH
jgi:hypothetical protein